MMRAGAAAVLCLAWLTGQAGAAQTQNVEVEPVTCWWRTSTPAVRVGEPFTITLTCSLLQTAAARAIVEESRLEPSAVQLLPLDLVGGTRARDLATAGRRFVQYEYRVRALAEQVLGSVVTVAPLEIRYRVESQVSGSEAVTGRELTYAMPPLSMRVLSLVPDTADDIREPPIATFAEVEALRTRATLFRVIAVVAFVLGLLTAVVVIVRSVRSRGRRREAVPSLLSPAAVLRGVRHELTDIRDGARASGWTPELVGRALAAARILAAYKAGRRVAQRVSPDGVPQSGEVVLRGRTRTTRLSASVASLDDAELGDALAVFGAARYGREAITDAAARQNGNLDELLEALKVRADQLLADRPLVERMWPR